MAVEAVSDVEIIDDWGPNLEKLKYHQNALSEIDKPAVEAVTPSDSETLSLFSRGLNKVKKHRKAVAGAGVAALGLGTLGFTTGALVFSRDSH